MTPRAAMTQCTRAGLTLIEVLASVVLLSIIAATCTSLLQGAATQASATRSQPQLLVEALGRIADSVIVEPQARGIESLSEVTEQELQFEGEARTNYRTIRLRRIESAAVNAEHFWLVFSSVPSGSSVDSVSVTRWVFRPAEETSVSGGSR